MATKKPKGLGLGLEALLGPTVRDPSPDASPSRIEGFDASHAVAR